MRRRMTVAVLMTTLCLLCACAGGAKDPIQTPLDYRAALLAHGGCTFTLEARVETGDGLWALTLACDLDPEGSGTVTVLAPESIAGITARISEGGAELRYGDLALGLGTLPGTELAPAGAPGALVRAWARAWIASAGADGEALLASYEAENLLVETWFDHRGLPLRADLVLDGRVCLTGEIHNFEWKAGDTNETVEEDLG